MTALALFLTLAFQTGDVLQDLRDKDPQVRKLAAQLCGRKHLLTSVGSLVRLLDDDAAEVKSAAVESLREITGDKDVQDWKKWWQEKGAPLYPETHFSDEQLNRRMDERMEALRVETKLITNAARGDVRFMTAVMAVSIILFLGVMIFFVGHVSSKIKGWRELVSRAEVYIKQSEELTKRTDMIVAELDAKKAELAAYFKQLREENESMLDRHKDEIAKSLQNEIREQGMTLRRNSEKELEQTVADLKTQLEIEARRVASEMRDRLAK